MPCSTKLFIHGTGVYSHSGLFWNMSICTGSRALNRAPTALPSPQPPYQVCREIDEVRVVLVDEFHHGALERAVVSLQVVAKVLYADLAATPTHELVHLKVSMQEYLLGEAELSGVLGKRHGWQNSAGNAALPSRVGRIPG